LTALSAEPSLRFASAKQRLILFSGAIGDARFVYEQPLVLPQFRHL
jgi:hypothetical protein